MCLRSKIIFLSLAIVVAVACWLAEGAFLLIIVAYGGLIIYWVFAAVSTTFSRFKSMCLRGMLIFLSLTYLSVIVYLLMGEDQWQGGYLPLMWAVMALVLLLTVLVPILAKLSSGNAKEKEKRLLN